MATQPRQLARAPGLRFARLLGTGAGIGFSKQPDLRSWALFCLWESEEAWDHFRENSRVMEQYHRRGDELYSLLLEPVSSHGSWGGELIPVQSAADKLEREEPVVVLTRAAIRLRHQLRFWSRVPVVDATLHGHPDLLLTMGAGEIPFLRQATLSVWRTTQAMEAWAYGNPQHAEVVRRTRVERWYSEELFARFRLLHSYGTLGGENPLAGRLLR
jgi:heme-degrading monooxygenase HmoA